MAGAAKEVVLVEEQEGYAVVTLNRPERRNALSGELISSLMSVLDELDVKENVRAIVLTGSGETFCAGGDLAGGMSNAGGAVGAHETRGEFGALFERMRAHSAIIIAAVNGDALGGGFGLAMGCDLALAAPDARFGTPEIRLGLFPWVILAVLQRHVGQKRLMEMVMLGQKIDASEAKDLGLINHIAEGEGCLKEAIQMAVKLSQQAPIPLRLGKAAFYQASEQSFGTALQFLNTQLTLNLMTSDAMEGVGAFLQRRKPNWKGQ